MSPLASFILLAVNALAFLLSMSVLVLALWQRTLWHSSLWRSVGMPVGDLLSIFLATQALLNLSVSGLYFNRLFLGDSLILEDTFNKLTVTAFALMVLSAFWLIVAAAGLMKQALIIVSRAGLVGFVVLMWPLWNGQFFPPGESETVYAPAGIVAAVMTAIYIGLALGIAWAYRRQIRLSGLLVSLAVLLFGQLLTLMIPILRVADLPSLLTPLVGSVLGVSLVRLQFFEPLVQRARLADAARALAECAVSPGGWNCALHQIADWSAKLLRPDIVMLLTPEQDHYLCVAFQSSGTHGVAPSFTGRQLPIGEGLAGRVFQTQQPMSSVNYHEWDGRSPAFDDPPLYAALSVPLVAGEVALGVVSVFELKPGRVFTERDRELLETLAIQAAVCLRLTQLIDLQPEPALQS